MAVQGSPEHSADGGGVGPLDEPSGDTEPGVIVDAGDGLELAAVGQPDPTHDVQLPQLHWPGPFPAPVAGLGAPAGAGLDEPVADQDPVDASQPGRRVNAGAGQLMGQAALAPARMVPAQFTDARLDHGWHLVRTGIGAMRAVGKGVQAASLPAA